MARRRSPPLPVALCFALGGMAACGSPAPSGSSPASASTTETGAPTPAATATPPDLTARPLIWFAPLPPMPTGPGRPFIGSEDFMQLFEPQAAWQSASDRIGVFKLYGEWVAYHATDDELRTAVAEVARRGMVLAVEMGPLDPPPGCGEGVESFAGIDEGRLITSRIRQAGGTLQVIALDEPYYFAHVYDGPNACSWPLPQVAEAVAGFTAAMRQDWPGLLVGDTEPMPAPVDAAGLAAWLDAYRDAAGEPFAFLHLDMDWSRPEWPGLGLAVEAAGAERDVPIGMIYNGGSATSDAQWLSVTGRRVAAYQDDAGARPDHVLFQSWMDKPDHVLPETDASTFTWLLDRYLDDPGSMGNLPVDGANLALGAAASASSQLVGSDAARAVDGDADTIWSAGAGPPAWIEIDLGAPLAIGHLRLLTSQTPAGSTRHLVRCAAAPGGALVVLADLSGTTADLDQLEIDLEAPATCRIIRIDTVATPSWVAWREIEVTAP